jgi:hypothetical protein
MIKNIYSLTVLLLVVGLSPVSVSAQFGSPGGQAGLNAAMTKLFGDTKSFTSQAEVKMLDKGGAETMTMPMIFSMLDGKIRADIDMARVKSKDMPAEAAASLKQMGMDKMVSIVRPDKKLTIIIYPALKSYAEVPMSKEDAADLDKKYTLSSSKLGNETIDGHPCEKNKVTLTGENGQKHEAIVWNASDLKQFPVQMQMNQQDANVVMRYNNVQLTRPDGTQFEAPAGFTKHPTVEKLMQDGMMKALGK